MKSPKCQNDEDIKENMQTDMACGPKMIPTSILKTFKKELSKPFGDQGLF